MMETVDVTSAALTLSSSSSTSSASTKNIEGAKSSCLAEDGLETPETRTPPPRSVSPSSDGGVSTTEGLVAKVAHDTERVVDGGELVASEESSTSDGQIVACEEFVTSRLDPSEIPQSKRDEAERIASELKRETATSEEKTEQLASVSSSQSQVAEELERVGECSGGCDLLAAGNSLEDARSLASHTPLPPQPSKKGSKAKKNPANHQTADDAISQQAFAEQAAISAAAAIAFGGFPMPMPEVACDTIGGTMTSFSDRRIIEVLAAPADVHNRLLKTARRVPEIILSDSEGPPLSLSVELYGSLSLDMTEPDGGKTQKEDWASYYINARSDVDFVVEVRPDTPPSLIAERLQEKGNWNLCGHTQVHKFASTQYTLYGNFGDEDPDAPQVYLDITCIESPLHYSRFKTRQEAFRKVFSEVRQHMEVQFDSQGALAFDAYIHLLKAFAAKVDGNALTGFQATCIGLFTLQIGHYRFKPNQSIALSLFEGFLRFCHFFFRDAPRNYNYWHHCYRTCGIDLSNGGRWLPRMSMCWRSELYFMSAEVKMKTRPDERVNVVHSLDPARVSAEAQALLSRAFLNNDFSRAFAAPGAYYPPVQSGPTTRPSTNGQSANGSTTSLV
mmetsp:Transcript_9887/g.16141  ORF Transcript_9887/g.16141 Transcript_9887/m.16141 type:complete len:617 (-) Transcript_9887:59-1909(-)